MSFVSPLHQITWPFNTTSRIHFDISLNQTNTITEYTSVSITPRIYPFGQQSSHNPWWNSSRDIISDLMLQHAQILQPNQPADLRPSKDKIRSILQTNIGKNFVDSHNHLDTTLAFQVVRWDGANFIMCLACTQEVFRTKAVYPVTKILHKPEHIIVRRHKIHLIADIRRFWCSKCQIPRFIWIPAEKCIHTSSTQLQTTI